MLRGGGAPPSRQLWPSAQQLLLRRPQARHSEEPQGSSSNRLSSEGMRGRSSSRSFSARARKAFSSSPLPIGQPTGRAPTPSPLTLSSGSSISYRLPPEAGAARG